MVSDIQDLKMDLGTVQSDDPTETSVGKTIFPSELKTPVLLQVCDI